METETIPLQFSAMMSNLASDQGFTKDAVSIHIYEVIEELIQDESGRTHVSSHPAPVSRFMLVRPSFEQHHLCGVLRDHLRREAPFCEFLADQIVLCRFSPAQSPFFQRPFLMTVRVEVVRQVRYIFPYVPVSLSRGASGDVFQRLTDEQRRIRVRV